MSRCVCSKDWQSCPKHNWERFVSAEAIKQEKAQREVRRQQKLARDKREQISF